jgi:hypothetical protein
MARCEECNDGKRLRHIAGPNGPIEIIEDCGHCDGTGEVEVDDEATTASASTLQEQFDRRADEQYGRAPAPSREASEIPAQMGIKPWQERCDWTSDQQATKLMVEAMKAEIADLRAALAQWETLRDPATLHANLLRGLPAKLEARELLHIAGYTQHQVDAALTQQAAPDDPGTLFDALAEKDPAIVSPIRGWSQRWTFIQGYRAALAQHSAPQPAATDAEVDEIPISMSTYGSLEECEAERTRRASVEVSDGELPPQWHDRIPADAPMSDPAVIQALKAEVADLRAIVARRAGSTAGDALSHDARECLQDVVSHYSDFRSACGAKYRCDLEAFGRDSASYWEHQQKVLDRMLAQAELALAAAPSTKSQEQAAIYTPADGERCANEHAQLLSAANADMDRIRHAAAPSTQSPAGEKGGA